MQYGANAETAKQFAVSEYLDLEPSLGFRYTMLDIDSLQDNVGKSAEFDTVHYLEAELGLKVQYNFCRRGCTNRVYIRPSVIQTFVKGGKTRITGLQNEIKSLKNETLGRVEVGGEFGLSNNWNGYAAAGYTAGEDYNAYDVNLGVNYQF